MLMPARKLGTILGCTRKVSTYLNPFKRPSLNNLAGWGKKMSYCIAFSIDGATDVTRRYVRKASSHGADRNRAPEEVLMWIMNEIRRLRRENFSKEERRRLIAEDDREEKELRSYVVQALAAEIGLMLPSGAGVVTSGSAALGDEQKIPAHRNGTAAWQQARTEDGSTSDTRDRSPPREGH